MKIGDHYDITRIGIRDWNKLARACTLEENYIRTLLTSMAHALPDHISSARDQALTDGLAKNVITPLAQQLTAHVRERLAFLRL